MSVRTIRTWADLGPDDKRPRHVALMLRKTQFLALAEVLRENARTLVVRLEPLFGNKTLTVRKRCAILL